MAGPWLVEAQDMGIAELEPSMPVTLPVQIPPKLPADGLDGEEEPPPPPPQHRKAVGRNHMLHLDR